jgi:UrcA family protein
MGEDIMNANPIEKYRPAARTPIALATTIAALAALSTGAPLAATAAGDADQRVESISEKVLIPKAQLATPEGQQAARARLVAIAGRLCRTFRDTRTLAHRETYAQCVADSMTGALEQIQPAVASAASAQRDRPNTVPAVTDTGSTPPQRVAGN